MKKLAKYIWIGIISVFIMTVICAVLLVKGGLDLTADAYNGTSIYNNTECDFVIPSPGVQQVAELRSKPFIGKVVPYYLMKTGVSSSEKENTENVIAVDDIDDLSVTLYNSERCIKGEAEPYGAFADYSVAKKFGLSVGDRLTIRFGTVSYDYTVCGIYETNSLYADGALLIHWSAEQKQAVSGSSAFDISYSGAWVAANDYTAAERYFATEYKPLGRLKDRSEFDSDEAYKNHVDAFNNASFAAEITDFRKNSVQIESEYQGYGLKVNLMFAFSVLLPALCSLCYVFVGYGKKADLWIRRAIHENAAARKKIGRMKIIGDLVETLIVLLVYVVLVVIYVLCSSTYIKLSLLSVTFGICGVAIVMSEVLVAIIDVVKFRHKYRSVS